MTALFWYIAIGCISYVRYSFRMKPYKERTIKFWAKAMPDIDPNLADEASNLFVCILIWPLLVTNFKVFWTNKDISAKIDRIYSKVENDEGL